MSHKIDPPKSFFGENIDLEPDRGLNDKKSTNKLFSFGGFNKNKEVKRVEIEENTLQSSVKKNLNKENEKLVYDLKSFSVKNPYTYGISKRPRFDESTKKLVNWGDMIVQSKAKKEQILTTNQINEKVAKKEVFDLFGEMKADNLNENDNKEELSDKINEYLSILSSNNVISKIEKITPKGFITSEVFFENLFKLIEFINAEERGRLLISCIFGCLISRSKFLSSGPGAKSGSSKFSNLIDALGKLTTGGSSNTLSKLYINIIEICSSSKLNKYRTETSTGDQVTNIVNFINRIVISKYPVFFPLNLQFSDPVAVYIGIASKLILDVKNIPLSSIPTLENLNDFFGSSSAKIKSTSTQNKKKIEDDYDNNYADIEDRETRGKGSDWQTNNKSGGADRDKKINKW